jgi:hypothetical protein
MVVGDNVAAFIDDEPGALTRLLEFRLTLFPKIPAEKVFELLGDAKRVLAELMKSRSPTLDRFLDSDVNHRRTDAVGQGTEILRYHLYRGIFNISCSANKASSPHALALGIPGIAAVFASSSGRGLRTGSRAQPDASRTVQKRRKQIEDLVFIIKNIISRRSADFCP